MKRGLHHAGLALLTCLLATSTRPAFAQEGDGTTNAKDKNKDDLDGDLELGLAPGTPQVGALPGGMTPAYGQRAADEGEWRFDFHGFLTMPLRFGMNTRAGAATTEQHTDVLHAPPVVPEYRDSFTYTSVVPNPYAQLNFSYGNSVVTGNVVLLARTATTAASFYNPPEQSGINEAYVNFRLPHLIGDVFVNWNVGAMTNRYGVMGEYDEGKYSTPVIARVNGVGETVVAKLGLGNAVLALEQGFQGQFDKFPADVLPAGWNGFGNPNAGSGFVNHLHAGFGYLGTAAIGLHYLQAWTQDDRASQAFVPDGKLRVLGADLRLTTGNLGHLYVAVARVNADSVGAVGRVLEIMNTGTSPVDLTKYRISDASAATSYRFALSGTLAPGQVKVYFGSDVVAWQAANGVSQLGLSLNNSGDTVFLYDVTGNTPDVADSYTYASAEVLDDRSAGRMPNGTGNWVIFDGLNPYKGAQPPNPTGCSPSPGAATQCPTPTHAERRPHDEPRRSPRGSSRSPELFPTSSRPLLTSSRRLPRKFTSKILILQTASWRISRHSRRKDGLNTPTPGGKPHASAWRPGSPDAWWSSAASGRLSLICLSTAHSAGQSRRRRI